MAHHFRKPLYYHGSSAIDLSIENATRGHILSEGHDPLDLRSKYSTDADD